MKITIDEDVCKKYNLDVSSVFAVLLIKENPDYESVIAKLKESEVLTDSLGDLMVTERWDNVVSNILLDSEQADTTNYEKRLKNLAEKMMEIFPKGKKEGTKTYWKGNLRDNQLRLKKFFKLYGDKYTDEQILDATKSYVSSFNGNYNFMRVLKYFIWKDVKKVDSEGNVYIEEISELATEIDNAGSENTHNFDSGELV